MLCVVCFILCCRTEYDRLHADMERAHEASVMAHTMRKNVAAEKRQVREQKDEAEAYQQQREHLSDMKTQLALWKVYHLHRGIQEKETALKGVMGALQERKEELTVCFQR